jgi:hypothetical protein
MVTSRGPESEAIQRPDRDSEVARKRRLDRALDVGLRDTFPGSDPLSITQPAPSKLDRRIKRKD